MLSLCYAQVRLILWDNTDYSQSGSSVYEVLQARIQLASCYFLLQGSFLIQGANLPLVWHLFWQVNSASSTPGKPFAGLCQVFHGFSTMFCIHIICSLTYFKIMKRRFAQRQRHFPRILCMLSCSVVSDSFWSHGL